MRAFAVVLVVALCVAAFAQQVPQPNPEPIPEPGTQFRQYANNNYNPYGTTQSPYYNRNNNMYSTTGFNRNFDQGFNGASGTGFSLAAFLTVAAAYALAH